MLLQSCYKGIVECGCDEAGRGCLAGPVYAAAVILPDDYSNERLNDSKKLSARSRSQLRIEIERDALSWAVASVEADEIDRINILRASFRAMCKAVEQLSLCPEHLLIDGNRFYNDTSLPYTCIVHGDAKYMSIAAASVLAKTYRDEHMARLHEQYPQYGWNKNKGYPTSAHYEAIERYGLTEWHRRSFRLSRQLSFLNEIEQQN